MKFTYNAVPARVLSKFIADHKNLPKQKISTKKLETGIIVKRISNL